VAAAGPVPVSPLLVQAGLGQGRSALNLAMQKARVETSSLLTAHTMLTLPTCVSPMVSALWEGLPKIKYASKEELLL
jgi:hypothetical protein